MKAQKKIITVRPAKMTLTIPAAPYKKDFYKWTRDQILHLEKQEFSKLDITHLIEEIESLGNSEKNALESYMTVLFLHMLKMKYQPVMRCNSWENSVENAKFRIKRLIQKNPSLKNSVPEFLPDAYYSARLQASSETGLNKNTFPKECPWTIHELFPFLKRKMK